MGLLMPGPSSAASETVKGPSIAKRGRVSRRRRVCAHSVLLQLIQPRTAIGRARLAAHVVAAAISGCRARTARGVVGDEPGNPGARCPSQFPHWPRRFHAGRRARSLDKPHGDRELLQETTLRLVWTATAGIFIQ